MREDFRCIACGHSCEYGFNEGSEKEIKCPKCNQLWKIESKTGRYRLLMWI